MTEIDQSILDDVDMYYDKNDTSNEDKSVSNSEYTMESMELDNTISYKCACNFEDSEGEDHIYNSSQISTNTFTKAESLTCSDIICFFFKPGAKISPGKTVDTLLKSKSSVKGHEYDVCSSGCQLYGINDNQESCVDCSKPQYKNDPNQSQTPAASMKLMSVRDMLSQMLADLATRELLCYRANQKSLAGQLTDIFDGDNYKQLVQQDLFSNPDDIAIRLYTNGFVNQKKGKNSYTIIYCIIFNLDPSIRHPNKYLLQLAILPDPKKPTHLDSFLISIINELSKVYLLLASGGIPAVADMAHIGSHTSLFGCHFCETKGKCPTNRWHGMYFDDISIWLRPLEDFKVGNPISIGKLVYGLITITLTKETKFYYTHPDNTLNTTEYPFHILRADLVTIGNCITSSQKYILTSFQGSFDNVFVKINSTRAVDWLDFLLYLVLTLVVPYLPNRAAKTALLSLVKDTSSTGACFYTNKSRIISCLMVFSDQCNITWSIYPISSSSKTPCNATPLAQ
ncbi:hypothetical protein PHYBLDRAFT_168970 [Phycomyces blakesleeanus NRRL 1555(-)]|uniref:Uncharacterized protein n=1 Tax=Phycomyces blakesleeanus (strain ATCC 8743b / DSM 1359 / FGSC 10004 / NBRC 33097 / NRRL 1555) TaxID=763407 RepID=A0A162NAW5_PHYB8|nr:hypothetical protein PHYBLDRAFT_168970 [Phycomyces blakesleeanus NRRL 1555(-)]OAD72708.1 hypothetical protein PHYBLDRAFT_168970 [Phycomyces blakesleeanus NRRL 1555(-)]|eukprot:XP_018290748.1 hypothetical protein PHYBLDRAFT_168970 [Phycomyces blakesleeanus NRRL 1555(-)]